VDYFVELGRKLKARIDDLSADRIVFVGVGNRSRGDDALGPLIIDLLGGQVPHAIDVGPSPENFTSAIKKLKPGVIVFIDALIFKESHPGTPQVVEIDDISHLGESTHTLSLDVVMEYLKMETGADVLLIGVQPGRIADREGLSPGIQESIEKIAAIILRSLKN
jgi:hydrogenase 3 maturation protease